MNALFQRLLGIFGNLSSQQKLLTITALAVKFILLAWVFSMPYEKISRFAFGGQGTDASSYIFPALNGLENLEYSRMPGFSILIFFFNKLFRDNYYLDALLIFQVILGFLVIILIYFVGKNIFSNKSIGFQSAIMYATIPMATFYELFILTEIYTSFFILFALLSPFLFQNSNKKLSFLIGGIFICLAFTFRPVSIILIPFLLLIYNKLNNSKLTLRYLPYFLAPIVLFELFWVPFNYKRFGEFHLLTKSKLYKSYDDNMLTHGTVLHAAFGGEDKEDWLINPSVGPYKLEIFPFEIFNIGPFHTLEDAYTDYFNKPNYDVLMQKIQDCKFCFVENLPDTLSNQEKNEIIAEKSQIKKELLGMRSSIIRHHPEIFIESRLKILFLFYSHNFFGSRYVNFNSYEVRNNLDYYLKYYYNIWIVLLLIFGQLGLLLMLFSKKTVAIVLSLCGLVLTNIYPLIFGMPEWRYLYCALPFLVIGFTYFIQLLVKGFRRAILSK